MKKIAVLGSSNMDFVFTVEEMPRTGETIKSLEFHKVPGGKGANQACACGKLGGDCIFLSAVGKDDSGEILLDSLKRAGVCTEKVLRAEKDTTGMAAIMVNAKGDNSIVIVPGANKACGKSYVEDNTEVIKEADVVLTQLETPEEGVYQFIEAAKAAGKTVILNPAPAREGIPEEILQGLDYLTPNETELNKLTGMPVETLEELEKASETLLKKGVKNVIVTIGKRGALLSNEAGNRICPAFTGIKAVDTTAAGDTFNAGLAVGLAEGRPLTEAILFANAAAAISVTRKGAQTSIPTKEEADELISAGNEPGSRACTDIWRLPQG